MRHGLVWWRQMVFLFQFLAMETLRIGASPVSKSWSMSNSLLDGSLHFSQYMSQGGWINGDSGSDRQVFDGNQSRFHGDMCVDAWVFLRGGRLW